MSEEIILSPRERRILNLLADINKLAVNFASKTRSELAHDAVGTDISTSTLSIAQAFSKSTPLTDKDLFLLRDISRAIKSNPALRSIVSLSVNEEYIAETYRDMMSKRAVIEPDYKIPCNISRLLSLGSEACSFCTSRSYSPCNAFVFPEKDSAAKRINAALNGYFPTESDSVYIKKDEPTRKKRRISSCGAVIIYTREVEKISELEDFFSKSDATNGVTDAFSCAPEEIFTRILKYGAGVSLNADLLPNVNILKDLPSEYRALIKTSLAFFDKVIFGNTATVIIAKKSKLDKISALAKARGLSVCHAISFKSQNDVSVMANGKPAAKLGISMINAMRDMVGHSAEIVSHDPSKLQRSLSIEKIFEDKNGNCAVYKTTFNVSRSSAPYHEAVYAALGLVAKATADGFLLNSSEFSFSANASLSLTDAKSTGSAVAAILGLYRTETELMIPNVNSSIERSNNDSKMTVYLKSHSIKRSDALNEITSIEPLIFSDLDENCLPDLENLKKFFCGTQSPNIIERFEA